MLLIDVEKEFGYTVVEPLELPYGVKLFQSVLCEVEQDAVKLHSPRCNFAEGHASGIVVVQIGPSKSLA
ncbi:unnamed protein product, partial [Musa hybrid cultivar]